MNSQARIAVYTAVAGAYDRLSEPAFQSPEIDYICFTDDAATCVPPWRPVDLGGDGLDQVRKCRRVKILSHVVLPEYPITVWVDGNVRVVGNPTALIERYLQDAPLAVPRHQTRRSVYEEAQACVRLRKDNPSTILAQIEGYHREAYTANNGLAETSVLIRQNGDPNLRIAMQLWWEQVRDYSRRDQLSFTYAAWKTGLAFRYMEENPRRKNGVFRKKPHKNLLKEIGYRIRVMGISGRLEADG